MTFNKTENGALLDAVPRVSRMFLPQNVIRFCTTQVNLISPCAHKKSAKYSTPIFMKFTIDRLQCVKITLSGFHPKRTINVERRHKKDLRFSVAWFPLRIFARNQQNLIKIL
jgi:hypothetical protein